MMQMPRRPRNVEIQLQRWRPQLLTLVVTVPEEWTDEEVKARLSEIYEESDPADDNWHDQVDFDPKEGTHELTGERDRDVRPDLVFNPRKPTDDDDD
jgi:hypothetical protein